ncbi:GM17675 [Drosophila sechellia]|uniref:GM17675 n=1 Tax=Drosophila sechellia TaxID=7238 RepID=B4IGD6_DROSE|nr:GM17675 [Drosophila sechellia]
MGMELEMEMEMAMEQEQELQPQSQRCLSYAVGKVGRILQDVKENELETRPHHQLQKLLLVLLLLLHQLLSNCGNVNKRREIIRCILGFA